MVYSGAQSNLLFSRETTYGDGTAPAKSIGLVTKGYEPSSTGGYVEGNYLGSIEMQKNTVSHYEFDGSVEFDVQHFRFMDFVLGGTTTHAETTGDWKHTFVQANTIPSMCIDMNLDAASDAVFRYPGTAIKTATINFAVDKPVTATLDMVSQTVDTSNTTATTAVIDDLSVFTPAMTTISVAGSTLTLTKDITLTIENNLADANYLSSTLRQHAVPLHRKYAITFTQDFSDMTEYERFLGGSSPQNSQTSFTTIINTNNGVTLGSGRREFNIQFTGCKYTQAPPKHPNDGLTNIEFTIVGQFLTAGECYSVDNISDVNW